MLAGKGLLTPIQRAFLAAFTEIPDQEHFYYATARPLGRGVDLQPLRQQLNGAAQDFEALPAL